MADQSKPPFTADRRTVLRASALGVAAAGVGVTAAACSTANSMPQGSNGQNANGPTGPVQVATTSQVPVNGGFINSQYNVVVTQPSAGEYKAFTAVCTHLQCTVGAVSDNVIQCPCHGSEFSAKDGSVVNGPATQPLAAEKITVKGTEVIWES
jgi:Rieske Fe-S protein